MPREETRIMYIERGGGLCRGGRIGRVCVSKTGRTLYYGATVLQSLNGSGYKTSHFDVETGEEYWVSRPRKDGNDPLYPDVVEVDADAREEYWRDLRGQPENTSVGEFRAPGKYSKRRPHPDNMRRRRT